MRIRDKIRALKVQVKKDAHELHLLKLCRRTKNNVHPAREALMKKFSCRTSADVQHQIWSRQHDATANLIAYGQLRGKEHTVKDPERWTYAAEKILE